MNNPYAAVLELTFQDLKDVCEEELKEWHLERVRRGDTVNHRMFILSLLKPLRTAILKIGCLAEMSVDMEWYFDG